MGTNPVVDNVNFEYAFSNVLSLNNGDGSNEYIEIPWDGPIADDKSFAGSLEFNVTDNAPYQYMIMTCMSEVLPAGWNIRIVDRKLNIQIGTGNSWLKVGDSIVTPMIWHKIAWQLNNTTNIAEIYFNGVKSEIVMSSNYSHPSQPIFIGSYNHNTKYRFSGEMKNIRLGSGFAIVPTIPIVNPNIGPDGIDYESISDTPVVINEFDVSTFINVIDQYSSDREWVQQALVRLRQELQEELDLNQKLKDLNMSDAAFLVTKVEQFMTDYSSEIVNVESELQQIYTQLQAIITENGQLMNSNQALKDRLAQLNSNGIDNSIVNIRRLINDNVQLLKSSGRWGDTTDSAFKFSK